jgi:hypothetical protein
MIDRALIDDSEFHQFRGAFVITDSLTGQTQIPRYVPFGAAFSDLSVSRERLLIIFALPYTSCCPRHSASMSRTYSGHGFSICA